jgi:hypothetical protein
LGDSNWQVGSSSCVPHMLGYNNTASILKFIYIIACLSRSIHSVMTLHQEAWRSVKNKYKFKQITWAKEHNTIDDTSLQMSIKAHTFQSTIKGS